VSFDACFADVQASLEECERTAPALALTRSLARAAALLSEAELLLHTLESSSLCAGSAAAERRRRRLGAAQQRFRSLQLRQAGSSQLRSGAAAADARAELLTESCRKTDPAARAALLGGLSRLQSSTARLEAASRTAHEAEETGQGVLAALAAQREHLTRLHGVHAEAAAEVSEAENVLRRMTGWSRRLLGL
jgi:hypothetical protein